MTDEFNRERLTQLRERAGWTKEELAVACGVTRRSVTDWETGRVALPPVEKLAEVFGVETGYFFRESFPEIDPGCVSFRALSTLTAKKQRSVLASARYACGISEWIDSQFTTPEVDLETFEELLPSIEEGGLEVEPVATLVRSGWGLRSSPVRELQTVLESHGIRIFGLPNDTADVDAFSFWLDGRPFILLDVSKSAERIRFDLAHELAHLILHKGVSTARSKHFEQQANDFAAAFLLPADGVLTQVGTASRQLRLSDVLVMRTSWGVSAMAMLRRLWQLGVILDWQYRTWVVELSAAGYRRGEPGGMHREQSHLLGQVLKRLREQGRGVGDIANEAGAPRYAVQDSFLGLAVLSLGKAS